MAEFRGARTVVLTERLDRRLEVEACSRVRDEKVVSERWVPRMSARGTEGWDLGVKGDEESDMTVRRPCRGAWKGDRARARGMSAPTRPVDFMMSRWDCVALDLLCRRRVPETSSAWTTHPALRHGSVTCLSAQTTR